MSPFLETSCLRIVLQSIPRSVLLDHTGRQLVQWPIKEIEELRENQVTFFNKEVRGGTVIEVPGTITASQVTT